MKFGCFAQVSKAANFDLIEKKRKKVKKVANYYCKLFEFMV